MRIWQRRAMAGIVVGSSSADVSLIRSLKYQERGRGVRLRLSAFDREVQVRHVTLLTGDASARSSWRRTARLPPRLPCHRIARASWPGSGRPACSIRRWARGNILRSAFIRLTSSASTSGSSSRSTGFSSTRACQASSVKSDSVAPAGLG